MLPRLHKSLEKDIVPVITKTVEGRDVSTKGAFPLDTPLCFCVKCPRALGARAVVIRWEKDGEAFRDYNLSFAATQNGYDEYQIQMDLSSELCGGEDGLFYYEILFLIREHISQNFVNTVFAVIKNLYIKYSSRSININMEFSCLLMQVK